MRIAIVTNMFPPLQSGSSHYAHRVALGLSSRGHDVLVVSPSKAGSNGQGFRHAMIPAVLIPSTPLTYQYRLPYCLYPLSAPLIGSALRAFRPDVIHASGHFLDSSIAAAVHARKNHVPLVLTVHTRFTHPKRAANVLMGGVDHFVLGRIWHTADAAIALDRQMYQYIVTTLGIDERRVVPIPLGIDIDEFSSKPRVATEVQRIAESCRVILSVTHITALKPANTVIHAFASITKDTQDARLVLIGHVYDQNVLSLIRKMGLKSKVTLLGEVSHDLIPSMMSDAIMEAHSLDTRTGFDNASMEAMAMGLPVISCVRADNFLRPWLTHRENVMLIRPGRVEEAVSAMRAVLEDKNLAARISDMARRTAKEHFSIRRLLNDLETTYSSLAGL